jgi:hypothetical protein
MVDSERRMSIPPSIIQSRYRGVDGNVHSYWVLVYPDTEAEQLKRISDINGEKVPEGYNNVLYMSEQNIFFAFEPLKVL